MTKFYSLLSTAILAIGMLVFTCQPLYSQSNSFPDIVSANLKNFGPIQDGNQVTGYYFFYEEEAEKRKDRRYVVSLLDQNLSAIGKKTIEGDRYMTLSEGTYNGDHLALKFADHREEAYTLRLFDRNGEEVSSHSLPYGTFDNPKYQQQMDAIGMGNQSLIPVSEKGFINYSVDTRRGVMSKLLYTISFIPNDKSAAKEWSYSTPEKSDQYEVAGFLATDGKVLLSTVVKRKRLMDRDMEYFVLGTDMTTGKKLFEKRVENKKYAMLITNAWLKEDNIQFFGQYYPKDSKTAKDNSLGLCTFTMDFDGNTDNYQYLSWARDFKKLLPSNEQGKIEDVGYLFFHDYIGTSSGSVFGIAENYRKTISAGGTAMQILSQGQSGVSASKAVVEDLYIFEFGEDFSLKKVKLIEKQQHNVALPSGSVYLSPQLLSLVVKSFQGFDYVFTQKEDDLFSVGYTDFEKRKGEKNGLVYGAVNYVDGEITTDKVDLATEAEELRVLPAKTGYVAVWEYYQKEKKMDIRLERINF